MPFLALTCIPRQIILSERGSDFLLLMGSPNATKIYILKTNNGF